MAKSPKIQWNKFCRKDSVYDVDRPFLVKGFKVATNDRVIIRVPSRRKGKTRRVNLPPLYKLRWPKKRPELLLSWPAKHKNKLRRDGDPLGTTRESIAGREISTKYHQLVATLPNVKYSPAGGEYEAIYFTFDGGDGLLMPMRK